MFGRNSFATLALVVATACVPALAQDTAKPDIGRMEDVIQSYVKSGAFMGSVLVAKDGKVLLDKGYGFANLEWQVPNGPDTKFRIGSMTKQFTAAAILLLQERGKLSVNDPVKKYLADAPPAWDKITIYNLLTHTAGIPNFTSAPDYIAKQRNPAKPAEIYAWFKDAPLEFEPGAKFAYSNSGYEVLGLIIEKVSGESYAQFLSDNIFKPLGLKNTGYDSNTEVIAHHAYGYAPGKAAMQVAEYGDMSVPFAAGGLYSTTHDLLAWDEALFGGKLLSPASLKAMTTPFLGNYAFGLIVVNAGGHRLISHSGGIQGFNTRGDYLPDEKVAVIVLANLNGTAPDQIGQALTKAALGMPVTLPTEHKAITLDAKALDSVVGIYQLAPQFAVTISRDGDHLFAQATGQSKFELFPSAPQEFFAKVAEITITFVADEKGHVSKMILHQNGHDSPANRVEP